MITLRVSIGLSLFLLFFCSPATEAQQKKDTVRIYFNWPAGLTAHVEQTWMKIETGPSGSDTVRVRSTNRMQALPHPEGRLIRSDSFELPDANKDKSLGSLEELLRQAPALFPDYVVGPEGDFMRVENLEQMRAVFDPVRYAMSRYLEKIEGVYELPQRSCMVTSTPLRLVGESRKR